MQKLFPAEPEITLYQDGFEKLTILNRQRQGVQLTELMDKTSDSFTIAVNGAWGTGKTVFLKCWVGHHLKNSAHDPIVVYFDAFEHDYQDDPLIALTSAIAKRLENDIEGKKDKSWLQTAFNKAIAAVPIVGRIGISMATSGAVAIADLLAEDATKQMLDDIAAAGAETVGDELAKISESFWKKEALQKHAMSVFREGLQALTEPDEDGAPTRRLILVVDELDRCRPDYALNMLETLKHVFAIPGVQFVLGVNMDALADSVRARYGSGYNAELYLQKFVHLTMLIKFEPNFVRSTAASLFWDMAKNTNTSHIWLTEVCHKLLTKLKDNTDITIRGLQQLIRLCAVTPSIPGDGSLDQLKECLLAGLLYLQTMNPALLRKIASGDAQWAEISRAFHIEKNAKSMGDFFLFPTAWAACFFDSVDMNYFDAISPDLVNAAHSNFDRNTLRELIQTHVNAFELR